MGVACAHSVVSTIAGGLRDLGRLVLPVSCPGCGAPDVPLCPRCRVVFQAPAFRCEQHAGRLDRMDGRPPLPVWTLALNVGVARSVVLAWKDGGRADLSVPLGAEMRRAGLAVGSVLRAADVGGPVRTGPAGERPVAGRPRGALAVVPVPSSAAAVRRRGEDLVRGLAVQVAVGCSAAGVAARAAPELRHRAGGRDQATLGSAGRARNAAGRFGLRRRCGPPADPRPVLLVDDVLTTGATLAACEDVLAAAGRTIVGAMTLVATPHPGAR